MNEIKAGDKVAFRDPLSFRDYGDFGSPREYTVKRVTNDGIVTLKEREVSDLVLHASDLAKVEIVVSA